MIAFGVLAGDRFGKVRAKAANMSVNTVVRGARSNVQVPVKSLLLHNLP